MVTAACGIDCRVCRLFMLGVCSPCGAGTSREAEEKIAAQKQLLGAPCPVLACARMNHTAYCLRDCLSFPCDNFASGPYPFSKGFLSMQQRRRDAASPGKTPTGGSVEVPKEHWETLARMDISSVCQSGAVLREDSGRIRMPFLQEELRIDISRRGVFQKSGKTWNRIQDPLLALLCLVYLIGAQDVPLKGRMVGVNELKTGHFFQGPHALDTKPLLRRFGMDLDGFRKAAAILGGVSMDLGDAAYAFRPFPRVPVYYLLWEGDAEFSPRLSVLFDETVEAHLPADAIWGLVNLVSHRLLTAGIPIV
ncbi:MAG: DUF3786 domain-containing protein [Deltaproteobacteria bacterium]|nr:DUF3786 domain-containing protein [Deltaproteobacteria bacterium]MBW2041145.1 DUF3786 domain-containing protein [Deltaproteobacteria bacterium]